jgi:hypothetical protein
MKSEDQKTPREQGKIIWHSILEQMAEGGGFFHAMLLSFKSFVKQYFLSFVLYGVLVAIIGAGSWYLKPKVYKADMTVSYVHYEKKIYADMLEKLNRLVQSNSTKTLSIQLGLPVDEVRKISSINSFNIRHEPLLNDLSTEKIPFYIEVGVKDPTILPELQIALVHYMNGTDFIQERLKYQHQKNEEELTFLQKRLASADSLNKVLITGDQKVTDDKSDKKMDLFQEVLTIYDRIQNVKGSLAFNKNVEVLDGFIASDRPAGKSLYDWILFGFLAGIALRFLVIIFK